MDKIDEFVDERQKSWCIHCGTLIIQTESNADHVPSKGLLRKPHPENLPVVQICKSCNHGFSMDEEYLFLFIHCVLAGSTEPDRHQDLRAQRALKRHAKLKARIERSKSERETLSGKKLIVWKPEEARIARVVLKNARGHAFYEYGEPMLTEPIHIWSMPLAVMSSEERINYENVAPTEVLPEIGSRMMTRVFTEQDLINGWVVVQDGTYRYNVDQHGLLRVRSVLFEYLATEVYWEH